MPSSFIILCCLLFSFIYLLPLIIKIVKKNALPDWVGTGSFFEIMLMVRHRPRYISDILDVPEVPGAVSKNVER